MARLGAGIAGDASDGLPAQSRGGGEVGGRAGVDA